MTKRDVGAAEPGRGAVGPGGAWMCVPVEHTGTWEGSRRT